MTSAYQLVMAAAFILAFCYFMAAGARTFEWHVSDVAGATLGQFSHLVTGAIGTAFVSYRHQLAPMNGIAAAAILLASLLLYEWSRRTIRERRFHIAWSGEVPDTVCEAGPYAYLRHPVYLSYVLAFLALLVAFPRFLTGVIFLFNCALYAHAARSDERDLAASELKDAYAAYKARTGMFFPRWRKAT